MGALDELRLRMGVVEARMGSIDVRLNHNACAWLFLFSAPSVLELVVRFSLSGQNSENLLLTGLESELTFLEG